MQMYVVITHACMHVVLFVHTIQGSWRLSLRSAFKNFRRDYPRNENQPPSKRKRIGGVEITDETTEEEYEEAIKELQAEHAKGKKGGKNHSKIKQLMEQTHKKRQKWIHDTNPLIANVVELFPVLSTSRGVSLHSVSFVLVHFIHG